MLIIILVIVTIWILTWFEYSDPPEGACCGDCIHYSPAWSDYPAICNRGEGKCHCVVSNSPACCHYVKRKVKQKGN